MLNILNVLIWRVMEVRIPNVCKIPNVLLTCLLRLVFAFNSGLTLNINRYNSQKLRNNPIIE